MPVNQPTTYIQRGPRNYVNLSGAILNPLAQGLGELAGQGILQAGKSAFGIHTPAEDYQQSLTQANTRALMEKVGSSWDESMMDPNFAARVEQDPGFKQRWALAGGLNEDQAAAFADTHLTDPMMSQELRKGGKALQNYSNADPVPNLAGAGVGAAMNPGINPNPNLGPTAPTPPTEAAPPSAPLAEGVQQKEEVQQKIEQGAQAVQSSPASKAVPELPGVAPVAPPSPQGVPETKPVQGAVEPQPLDKEKFADQVKAYMLRQQGRLGLYRQMINAATTGKMDTEQAAVGAALSGVHQAELTQLMETVAPSMGLPLHDNNGKPIQGNTLLDGMANTFIMTNPDGFKKLPAEQQQDMLSASRRYQTLVGNVDATKAMKIQQMVDTFSKSKLASPEAFLNYANAERQRQVAMSQWKDEMGLKKDAQEMDRARLASQLESQRILNEGQRLQLEITRKYAGPQAELQMQKARTEVQADMERLHILSTKEQRDNLTTILAAMNSKAEHDAKLGIVWYQDNQRKQAGYLKGLAEVNKNITNLQSKNSAILQHSYTQMNTLRGQLKDDSKINAWISTQDKDFQKRMAGASPNEKFEQYYRTQDPQYAAYATEMDNLNQERDNLDTLFTNTVSAQAPSMGKEDPLQNNLRDYAKNLVGKQLAPLMKAEMKGLYKDASPDQWDQVLQENPTSVNILLGKTLSRDPEDKGWNNSDKPGTFNESRGLLILARGSVLNGKQYDAQSFANTKIGNKTLSQIIGPTRIGNYYNSYVQLMGELK